LKVRAASPADDEAILALMEAGDRHHARFAPDVFKASSSRSDLGPDSPNDVQRVVMVAELDGSVVGYVDVRVKKIAATPATVERTIGHVDSMVVAEDRRRRGVARELMKSASGWAREHGCATMELFAFDFNVAALSLYASLGFHAVGHRLSVDL